LDSVKQNWEHNISGISEIFNRITDFLKVYTSYCNDYSKSLSRLTDILEENKEFSKFINTQMQDPRVDQSLLSSYLILPVQRIPRYVFLLKALIEATYEDEDDFQSLMTAFTKIEGIAQYQNQQKREAENLQQVFEIQSSIVGSEVLPVLPHRRYIDEGSIMYITPDNPEKENIVFMFLFTDMVMITKKKGKKKKRKEETKFKYTLIKRFYITHSTELVSGFPPEVTKAPTTKGFYLLTEEENEVDYIIFGVYTEDEQTQWINLFESIIAKHKTNVKSRLKARNKSSNDINNSLKPKENNDEGTESDESNKQTDERTPKFNPRFKKN